jgi:acetylglutamate synthase
MPKKAQITQKRVEYNVFLFDEPSKGSKSLKNFKISLTFRFDKLSNLSKSVHTGENSQILTSVEQKKNVLSHCVTNIASVTSCSSLKYRYKSCRMFVGFSRLVKAICDLN